MFGMWELLIILLIVLVLFGAKRLPDLMGGIGKGINAFKTGIEGAPQQQEVVTRNDKSA